MQSPIPQAQTQPFIKLAQSNMALLTRFATSPEVLTEAGHNFGQLMQQASTSAMKLMQSGAYAQLMQGMMQNYSEFLMETAQGSMSMLTQGGAEMVRRWQGAAQQAVEAGAQDVVDSVDARGRRARQAA